MAEETHVPEPVKPTTRKRKTGQKKGSRAKKKQKPSQRMPERVKIDPKLKKFLRKKAREYNSDSDDEKDVYGDGDDDGISEEEDAGKDDVGVEIHGSENEEEEDDDEIQPGITKLNEGCRAFGIAFRSIMKKTVSDDALGPVLSGHKKLLAEKLAEEEAEKKVKGEAKKEKQLVGEKGHSKPANFLDSHEKFLISVATKGGIKTIFYFITWFQYSF
uniref:Uncharacterized protein MANES_13G059900 n=1 Tax=Rhizophora mucronata TaxID=61149 RepID=A0A2P2M488_RHIMU